MFGQWSFHWKTNNREPMIWRRRKRGVVSPLFFSSLLQAPPFASPTTVIANFSNYYKLLKTLDNIVINMALVFCTQSSVCLGVLNLF
jgi:hypothetical protein